jgi:hypothetical protein
MWHLVALKEEVPRCCILSLHPSVAVDKGQPPCVIAVIVHIHKVRSVQVPCGIWASTDGLRQVPGP